MGETLYAFVTPAKRFSCALYRLGATLLEALDSQAGHETAGAAAATASLLEKAVESLAEADGAAALVAAETLLAPAYKRIGSKRSTAADAKRTVSSWLSHLE